MLLHHRRIAPWPIAALAAIVGTPATNAQMVIHEGFEDAVSVFAITSAGGVPVDPQATDRVHVGEHSLRVGRSACAASCFDSYRADLVLEFAEPVFLERVELWASEHSTSGTAWGGKLRVGHDGRWNLDWWGIVNNGQPTTPDWLFKSVEIGEMATNVHIRVWDMTSRSTVWLDDITISYSPCERPPCCPSPANLTCDCELDFFDFLQFQDLFAAGDLRADFDGSGSLDFFDFLAFQNTFAAGCP